MKLTRLKAYLAAALVAVAGMSARADDAPEEEVVAFDEIEFRLGPEDVPEDVVVAFDEIEFRLGPEEEVAVATDEIEFALLPSFYWKVGDATYAYTNGVGVLTIFGEGPVTEWPEGLDRDAVKGVVVDNGVTTIGVRFFKKCYNLKFLTGGANLVHIGEKAFYLCLSMEDIAIANPAFDPEKDGLYDAIVYRTAIDEEGRFYQIPNLQIAGCQVKLLGKKQLTDPDWDDLGVVSDWKKMTDYGEYRFFKTVLEKVN